MARNSRLRDQFRVIAAAARASAAALEPRTWGHLTNLELVGEGGYGRVYRARDPLLDRDVALKLLKDGREPRHHDALIREARRLARVRHPNVITIFGADRVGSDAGIWMEFVDGTTLADVRASAGPMPVEAVIAIGCVLADALSAVHAVGLVHGDVKPSNILIADDGRTVLTDFGAGRGIAEDVFTVRATERYAAPEVLAGGAPTVAGDIYSLGIVLGELAEDRALALRAVLRRATAARPEDRYPSATAFGAALRDAAPVEPRVSRRRGAVAAGVLSVLAAVLITSAAFTARPTSARQEYLQGRQEWNKRTKDGFRRAMTHFEAALASEPEHAGAWASVAQTYVLMAAFGTMPPNEALPRATAAAERAIQINPAVADAYVALAYVEVQQGQIPAGERLYRRAIELDAKNTTAHHWYGLTRTYQDPQEALRHLQRAYELDPLSQAISADLAIGFKAAGRIDDAIAQYRRVIEVFPDYLEARVQFATLLIEIGRHDEAERQARTVLERAPTNVGATGALIAVLAAMNRREELSRLRARVSGAPDEYSTWIHALAAASAGDEAATIHWIRRGAAEKADWVGGVLVSPMFARWHNHPEVRAIVTTFTTERDEVARASVRRPERSAR